MPPAVQVAHDAAIANLGTPEGQSYDRTFEAQVSARLYTAVRSCVREGPSQPHTDLLYRIDASGRPVETFVYPDTHIGSCVRDTIAGFALPPPPAPDYWVIIRLGY